MADGDDIPTSMSSAGTAMATTSPEFSGQATGLSGVVGPVTIGPLADTGPLPSSGGALHASLLSATLPAGLGSADTLSASTVGGDQTSSAEATVATVTLTVAGNNISATLIRAQASATCGPKMMFG